MTNRLYAPEGDIKEPPVKCIVDHPAVHTPGVYFGLPAAEYHQALALSSHGIRHLKMSPLDFWARTPALNPEFKDEDTEAKKIGRAFDARITEGAEAFSRTFAIEPDVADFPGALVTVDDLRARLRTIGKPVSGNKAELISRLIDADPRARIWDVMVEGYRQHHEGKGFISSDLWHRIEVAAAYIEKHPTLGKAFTGGYAQPSIFWVDRETGIPCKARLDFLKPRAICDLKTVESSLEIPLKKAFARAIASYKYHIQGRFYLDAVFEARQLISAGEVYGDVSQEFLDALVREDEQTFLWVVQRKGIAPLARGFIFENGGTMDIARYEIELAKAEFAKCWRAFGTDPWLVPDEIEAYEDLDFPSWIND